MSRNLGRKSMIVAGFALFGLLSFVFVTRASALDVSSYAGRYACNEESNGDTFTAIIKYGPDGAGAYNGGTLIGSLTAFSLAFPTVSPTADYCLYALDLNMSFYTISSKDGTGFENLVWNAGPRNDPACPASFTDQTAISLGTVLNSSGQTLREEFVSADLFGTPVAGHGSCVK